MRLDTTGRLRRTAPWSLLPLALLLASVGSCAPQVGTRVEQIQRARQEKAAQTKPEELSPAEVRLNRIVENHVIERLAVGFHGLMLVWGGLPVGQGFAVGPEYFLPNIAGGAVKLRTSARATTGKALLLDFQLAAPKLAGEAVFFDVYAAHRNLSRPLSLGLTGGWLKINTGPGNRGNIPQTDEIFAPKSVPGLNEQTTFLRGGFFVQYDYRDNPSGPRRGGNYVAKFVYYDDRELTTRDHRQLDLEAQQYFPFWNDRRVIALRVATSMTFTTSNSVVPLYLQPHVGGSNDLRGFRPYRFHDNNFIVANAEYRFEAFTGLDMAIFLDAEKAVAR